MPPGIALNKIDWEIVNKKKRKIIFLHNFLLFLYGDFSIWCGESDEQIEHTTNWETVGMLAIALQLIIINIPRGKLRVEYSLFAYHFSFLFFFFKRKF